MTCRRRRQIFTWTTETALNENKKKDCNQKTSSFTTPKDSQYSQEASYRYNDVCKIVAF